MKKIYTFHYSFNDFDTVKEKIINLNPEKTDFSKYEDVLTVLDKCKKAPKQSVVDKIIEFSKSV